MGGYTMVYKINKANYKMRTSPVVEKIIKRKYPNRTIEEVVDAFIKFWIGKYNEVPEVNDFLCSVGRDKF